MNSGEVSQVARAGQIVYFFWFQSITGSWRSAWRLEKERLLQEGKSVVSWGNEMIRFTIFQTLWLVVVGILLGPVGLVSALCIALISILLLETINYVEPIHLSTEEQRIGYLKQAHYNPFLLNSNQVLIDFLTDSGTSAMSSDQWSAMMNGYVS